MPAVKDWVSAGADQLDLPCSTRYFADGHATDWCVHTIPNNIKAVSATNHGTADLYVAFGPALTGSATGRATAHAVKLAANESRLFVLDGKSTGPSLFSTFGEDGAGHMMRFVFEARS